MNKLIQSYQVYIKLLQAEIDELLPLAVAHGWRSKRHQQGAAIRARIATLQAKVEQRSANKHMAGEKDSPQICPDCGFDIGGVFGCTGEKGQCGFFDA